MANVHLLRQPVLQLFFLSGRWMFESFETFVFLNYEKSAFENWDKVVLVFEWFHLSNVRTSNIRITRCARKHFAV